MRKTKEIRHILMGQTIKENNGDFRAARKGELMPFTFGGNALDALFLGIASRRCCFAPGEENNPEQDGSALLAQLGRSILLEETPQVSACYYAGISAPRVFTAEITPEGNLLVTEFMVRGLLSRLRMYLDARKIKKMLPEEYEPVKLARGFEVKREKPLFRGRKKREKKADE